MHSNGLILCVITCAASICCAQSSAIDLLRDLSTLIPPCSTRATEVLAINPRVYAYINDKSEDGSYVFAYILFSGERRYERGVRYAGSLHVDGLYSYRKLMNSRYIYETTRYRAGKDGYHPSKVEITYEPPKVPMIDF